jgi:hypothetical protein
MASRAHLWPSTHSPSETSGDEAYGVAHVYPSTWRASIQSSRQCCRRSTGDLGQANLLNPYVVA